MSQSSSMLTQNDRQYRVISRHLALGFGDLGVPTLFGCNFLDVRFHIRWPQAGTLRTMY